MQRRSRPPAQRWLLPGNDRYCKIPNDVASVGGRVTLPIDERRRRPVGRQPLLEGLVHGRVRHQFARSTIAGLRKPSSVRYSNLIFAILPNFFAQVAVA